jgi:hypothetical protein
VSDKNHKKIAVVYNTTLTAIVKFHDAFLRNYNNPHEDFVVNDAQSAKVTATKIVYGDFDSVIIFQDGVEGPAVTKELKNLDKTNKLTFYFYGQLGSAWGEYQKLLGDTNKLNGANFFKIKTEDLSVFKEKYKTRFGSDPAPYAEYGYDSAMIMLNTYDKDNKSWLQKIENTNYKGFSGAVKFDSDGIRLQEAVITTVQNGTI